VPSDQKISIKIPMIATHATNSASTSDVNQLGKGALSTTGFLSRSFIPVGKLDFEGDTIRRAPLCPHLRVGGGVGNDFARIGLMRIVINQHMNYQWVG
jgi:hypothetical protein